MDELISWNFDGSAVDGMMRGSSLLYRFVVDVYYHNLVLPH